MSRRCSAPALKASSADCAGGVDDVIGVQDDPGAIAASLIERVHDRILREPPAQTRSGTLQ
jgi:hypothetical protein